MFLSIVLRYSSDLQILDIFSIKESFHLFLFLIKIQFLEFFFLFDFYDYWHFGHKSYIKIICEITLSIFIRLKVFGFKLS
jgi:hypothetical protein